MKLAVVRSKFAVLALVALAAATNGALCCAEQHPLWEAGAGLTVLDFPDYRGSDERHTLV